MPAVAFTRGTALPDPIYVDASVLIAFFYKTHQRNHQATVFMLEAVAQARRVLLTTLTVDELWHILMAYWNKEATGCKFKPNKPNHVARWSARVKQTTDDLLQISNVQLCPPHSGADLVARALGAMTTHRLAARDSFHVAAANAAGSLAIATMDADFDVVLAAQPALTILKIA
jgi:predicted nucleic acid-binding protein